MPARKNEWLNAKPMTKTGGQSGGVRNPKKPYKKPTKPAPEKPARWDAKTKSERLQEAAKTKPASPAPRQVVKKPVTRTGPVKGPVAPKGSTGPIKLPNSQRAGVNLPKVGARTERTATRAIQPRSPVTKPAPAAVKPAAKPAAAPPKPAVKAPSNNPFVAGKPNPGAAVRGVIGATSAAGRLGKNLSVGRLGLAASLLGAANAVDDARLTPAQLKEKYKVVDPNRGQRIADRMLGGNQPKPITKGNAQSRFAGARDANLNRINTDPRFAAPKDSPKPPAPTQDRGSSTQSRNSGSGSGSGSRSSAPSAPRRQSGPASDAGMKNQDKNYRGNLFEKTFGYIPGQAPDQQKAKFKSVDNKFGQDSGYQPQTKVDGSKYADKKPDMKKVKEYDRLRRKYYD